jgi:hypothetical protein
MQQFWELLHSSAGASCPGVVSMAGESLSRSSASGVSVAGGVVADAGVVEVVAVAPDGAWLLAGAARVVAGGEVSALAGAVAAGAVHLPAASAEMKTSEAYCCYMCLG